MARPSKTGLTYFPMDVDFDADDKIYMIEAKHRDGYKIIVKLLADIYRGGYFKAWSERELLIFAGKKGIPAEDIRAVVDTALEGGFFHRPLFEAFGILTSAGIQRRYVVASTKRRRICLDSRYALVTAADFSAKLAAKLAFEVCGEKTHQSGTETPQEEPSGTQIRRKGDRENGNREIAVEPTAPESTSPDADVKTPAPGPDHHGPQFELALDWCRRFFDKTAVPLMPVEEHYAAAAKLLRQLGGRLDMALEASRRYFEESYWFTHDKGTRKPSYSFAGFCAHASEILAANGHKARPGPPARKCPVCGSGVVGSMRSCGECGMEVSKFGDREAVEEHRRWHKGRSRTSKQNAPS